MLLFIILLFLVCDFLFYFVVRPLCLSSGFTLPAFVSFPALLMTPITFTWSSLTCAHFRDWKQSGALGLFLSFSASFCPILHLVSIVNVQYSWAGRTCSACCVYCCVPGIPCCSLTPVQTAVPLSAAKRLLPPAGLTTMLAAGLIGFR